MNITDCNYKVVGDVSPKHHIGDSSLMKGYLSFFGKLLKTCFDKTETLNGSERIGVIFCILTRLSRRYRSGLLFLMCFIF
jgi:hypothetical protein